MTALRRWLANLPCRIGAWCVAVFGPVEFTTNEHRGYRGPLATCSICHVDVHDVGEMCPRQCSGLCSGCGQIVLLDGYLRCPDGGETHVIAKSSIHPTTEAEWRRPHHSR